MPTKEGFEILDYINDPNIWKHWLMEGTPKPHEAAAYLSNWLANFELSVPEHRTGFWTLRSAAFYNAIRWANYEIRGQWGERAEFFEWSEFLSKLRETPEDAGLLFFPGKFRTLPTPIQVETICLGLKDLKNKGIVSALVIEPRKNIVALEGEKLVLDNQIRTWAYSQLPVDIITEFPVIPEQEELSQFYSNRYGEIRRVKSGYVGVGVGISNHRNEIISQCLENGIEVVDTSIFIDQERYDSIDVGNTSDFDNLSSKPDLANELILAYLRNMGQI